MGTKVTGIYFLTAHGMDPTIHLVHIKTSVADDTVMEMGGEATKGQDKDDGMEINCEEEIYDYEMTVEALVLKFMLPFILSVNKKLNNAINILVI